MGTGTTERPTQTENITVLQIGEYGVRVGENLWYNTNKPLLPTNFAPDTSYKVSVVVSKTGKKYINSIIGTEDKAMATQAAAQSTSVDPAIKAAEEALAKAKAEAQEKAKAAAVAAKAAAPAAQSGSLTKDGYWERKEAKDEVVGMLRCRSAAFSAALSSPALAQWSTNVDEYIALARKVADAAVKYVNE